MLNTAQRGRGIARLSRIPNDRTGGGDVEAVERAAYPLHLDEPHSDGSSERATPPHLGATLADVVTGRLDGAVRLRHATAYRGNPFSALGGWLQRFDTGKLVKIKKEKRKKVCRRVFPL